MVLNKAKVNKRRKEVGKRKGALSVDPLDWLNISSVSDVPRYDEPIYKDNVGLNFRQKIPFWRSRQTNIQFDHATGQHYSPDEFREIGFAGFWGDYRMEGTPAYERKLKGENVQGDRIRVQQRLSQGYKKANCNECGQVIKVQVDKRDDSGNLMYFYDTLAWDLFDGSANNNKCDKCNTAMTYNFALEKFRKGKWKKEMWNRKQKTKMTKEKSVDEVPVKRAALKIERHQDIPPPSVQEPSAALSKAAAEEGYILSFRGRVGIELPEDLDPVDVEKFTTQTKKKTKKGKGLSRK